MFTQFLNETKQLKSSEVKIISKYVSDIKKQCAPFFQSYKGIKLYRGIKSAAETIIYTKSAYLDHREPLDSEPHHHNVLNKAFTYTFNHPYRNGVFVVGKQKEADMYGDVHIVIPIGDFDYIWSPYVSDMFSLFGNSKHIDQSSMKSLNEYLSYLINKHMSKSTYKTKLLSEPNTSTRFVMMLDLGVAQQHSDVSETLKELSEQVFKILHRFLQRIYVANKDLNKAANKYNTHEIMLWCSKYYAIKIPEHDTHADIIRRQVLKQLGFKI